MAFFVLSLKQSVSTTEVTEELVWATLSNLLQATWQGVENACPLTVQVRHIGTHKFKFCTYFKEFSYSLDYRKLHNMIVVCDP